jgi:glutathione synthase/RimK-type ligase-like ATP-grasp enzyme
VTVLVVTNKQDVSADWLIRELRRREHDFLPLNTEDLPQMATSWHSEAAEFVVRPKDGSTVRLSDISSVWYRRPGRPYGDRPSPDSPDAVLNAQWRALLDAMALARPSIWVNHPLRNSAAESKIRQLQAAVASGFRIPQTLVSNDPDTIRTFCSDVRDVIVKALDSPLVVVGSTEAFMFTTHVTADHLVDDTALSAAPMIYQERIQPREDIRVTVVGSAVFAARAANVSEQDWRLESHPVLFEPCDIPEAAADACRRLVSSLGLTFGAIDLLRRDDAIYFLEVNPNGEWGWLQARGLKIAEALADVLA